MSPGYETPIGRLLITEDPPQAFNWLKITREDHSRDSLTLNAEEVRDLHYALGRTIARLDTEAQRALAEKMNPRR